MKNKSLFEKIKYIIPTALILLVCLMIFVGCDESKNKTVRVMLSYGEGVTVESENPVDIPVGSDATFKITLGNTVVIDALSEGEYSEGVVTVKEVQRRTIVNLITTDVGYDTTERYKFYFSGGSSDYASIKNGTSVNAGSKITVKAKDKYKIFLGWSLGAQTTDEKKMISTEREFEFRLAPSMLSGKDTVRICANYAESNIYYYDSNGGVINRGTFNMQQNDYYSATVSGGRAKITLSERYASVVECASLFFDDGTFTRDGYVLTEYNTKPDGSGEGYSLGSKFYADPEAATLPVLYCIWQKATPSEHFTYESLEFSCPTDKNNAPSWHENGVIITGYLEDAETVVIPEKIGNEYVIGIKSGAFVNKSMKTLVLSKSLQIVQNGAFVGCDSISTVYYSDGIYEISDAAFDADSYKSLKNFYVNATIAPRFMNGADGAFSVKLSRVMASKNQNRIIVVAGSSTYQGLSSQYVGALLEDRYRVVNFGTTRTTNGAIYLEAMGKMTHGGDIILYAPENSTYMMGEPELYWKTLRDMEGMYNLYRYIDISGYKGILSAYSDLNKRYRYVASPTRYEAICDVIVNGRIDKYGEYHHEKRVGLSNYIDAYVITMNEYFKSKYEGDWSNVENQQANADYKNPENITWAKIIDEPYKSSLNRAINAAKAGGAKVYFSFCPVDADKLIPEAKSRAYLEAYGKMIEQTFDFDGVLGDAADYVFDHEYFYDCAFHPNDYGRTYRSYRLYVDLCELLSIVPRGYRAEGTGFEGCLFEEGVTSGLSPKKTVDYLN